MSGKLPKGWALATLSDLGNWLGGGTPSKSVAEYWKNGTIHWVSPKDMKRMFIDSAQDQITENAVAESATNLVPVRSVLMVTRSGILEHTFPVAVNTIPVAINQDLKALTPHPGVSATYIAFALKSMSRQILESCSKDGTTVSSIDFDRLSRWEVPLAPNVQQKRTVSKIDELFSRIDDGERSLEQAHLLIERCRKSVRKAAVTGELTREWRERHKDQVESGEALLNRILAARRDAQDKTAKERAGARAGNEAPRKPAYRGAEAISTAFFGDLPAEWERVRVDVAGEVQLGRQRSPRHHLGPFMRPYLRVANVFESRIDLSDVMEMNFTPEEFASYELHPGDVLLNEGQSKELVGRPALYRGELPGACFTNTLVRFRAISAVKPEFALLVFLHYMASGYFQRISRITTNISHLGAGRFAEMPFPVPSLREQAEILRQYALWESTRLNAFATMKKRRREVHNLRRSILHAAFTGRLVPQDPNDEPASVLLERIAAERAVAKPEPKQARAKRKSRK